MKLLQVKPLFLRLPIFLALMVSMTRTVAETSDGNLWLRLEGSRISLHADNVPLREVLEAFAAYGVSVHAQANLAGIVSGRVEQGDADETLKKILGGYNHITTWREYPYEEGTVSVLSGIRVFSPDRPGDPLRPIPAGALRVRTLPDGTRVVADEVIIGMKPGTSAAEFRALLARVGGQVIAVDPHLGVYRVRLPANSNLPDVLARLRAVEGLAVAEPNLIVDMPPPRRSAAADPSATPLPPPPSPPEGAPALAILDSGLNPEWFDPAQLRGSRDMIQPDGHIRDPNGHGTQMTLLAAGMVTPAGAEAHTDAVPLVAIRSFDDEGRSTSFGLLQSLQFARAEGARVMSMSWGSDTPSEVLSAAFDQAAREGMILLAAAGNEGAEAAVYPAAYPGVIAVGAMTPDGTPWAQTNRGEHLALLSYGSAAFPVGHDGPPGQYAGTSIATPWVASAITAYLGAYPDAEPEQVLRALTRSLSPHVVDDPAGLGAGLFDTAARKRFMEMPPE